MPNPVFSEVTASVSEFKKNPMATMAAGEGFPVAVLNRNKPAFYCIPADIYEQMLDRIEDDELLRIVEARRNEEVVEVNLDDL